jgi:hypothetical protein
MSDRKLVVAGLAVALASATLPAQTPASTLPRTADGHPDLQGDLGFPQRHSARAARTFCRPRVHDRRGSRRVRTACARTRRRATIPAARSLEEQSVHPVWWLDYGKNVVKTARTSLILDPPDGIMKYEVRVDEENA